MEAYSQMDIDQEKFERLLVGCIETKVLLPCKKESQFPVYPLLSYASKPRVVIHPRQDKDRDDVIYNLCIHSQLPYSCVTDKSFTKDVRDMKTVLARIESEENFYYNPIENIDLRIIDKYIKKLDPITVARILRLCCFFEAGILHIVLLERVMNYLITRITDNSNALFTLAQIAIQEEGIVDEFTTENSFGASMRIIDLATQRQKFSRVEPTRLNNYLVFMSATNQVLSFKRAVIDGDMKVGDYITKYNAFINSQKNTMDENKAISIMQNNAVLTRVATVLLYFESTLSRVPVFNFMAWQFRNISKILDKRKTKEIIEID